MFNTQAAHQYSESSLNATEDAGKDPQGHLDNGGSQWNLSAPYIK